MVGKASPGVVSIFDFWIDLGKAGIVWVWVLGWGYRDRQNHPRGHSLLLMS